MKFIGKCYIRPKNPKFLSKLGPNQVRVRPELRPNPQWTAQLTILSRTKFKALIIILLDCASFAQLFKQALAIF